MEIVHHVQRWRQRHFILPDENSLYLLVHSIARPLIYSTTWVIYFKKWDEIPQNTGAAEDKELVLVVARSDRCTGVTKHVLVEVHLRLGRHHDQVAEHTAYRSL